MSCHTSTEEKDYDTKVKGAWCVLTLKSSHAYMTAAVSQSKQYECATDAMHATTVTVQEPCCRGETARCRCKFLSMRVLRSIAR